eukprot:gene9387-10376_t
MNGIFEKIDSTLSFLDGFVADALAKGALPYLPMHLRSEKRPKKPVSSDLKKVELNVNPYPLPRKEPNRSHIPQHSQPDIPADSLKKSNVDIVPVRQDNPPQKAVKQLWGPSGYQGSKTEDIHKEPLSDSSSVTSGSGSVSSGVGCDPGNTHQIEQRSEAAISQINEDTERMTLAQQIFTQGPSQGKSLRTEKAGFNTNRRHHGKQARLAKTESAENAHVYQKSMEASRSDDVLDYNGRKSDSSRKENSLLLDLEEDLGNNENIDVSDTVTRYSGTNMSLLGDLVTDSQVIESIKEEMVEKKDDFEAEDIYQEHEDFLMQHTSNEDQPLPTNSVEDGVEVNILDQDNSDFLPPSLQTDTNIVERQQASQPVVLPHLDAYPKSQVFQLCEDTNIKLDCQKILAPDLLILVLFTTNQKAATLTDLNWSFRPPLNLDSNLDQRTVLSSNSEAIDGWQSDTKVLSMKLKSPSRHMILDGQVSYRDSTDTEKRLFIKCPLLIVDFMRPLMIDTEAYAGKWQKTAYEKRLQILADNTQSLESLIQTVESQLHFAIVQIIGNEAIAAGTIVNKDDCLLHLKHSSTIDEFRLKTGSELLNDCIVTEIKKSFSS